MQLLLPPNSFIIMYFIYGLAFFILGLAVIFEAQRLATNLPFARAMLPLALFGLLHGIHEWLEMFIIEARIHGINTIPIWLEGLRVAILAISFAALIAFGIKLLYPNQSSTKNEFYLASGLLMIWMVSVLLLAVFIHPGEAMRLTVRSWLLMADTWSRYSLAIPGALLSSYALWVQANELSPKQTRFSNYLYIASATFFIYGSVGQVFATETYLFPSQNINSDLFEQTLGIPIQLVRAVLATMLALTLIPTLNMFELERKRQLENAQQQIQEELARREALRRDMLRHNVATQEEERRRISRELHDEIGQTLTALSLGLQNVSQIAKSNPEKIPKSIQDLQNLTSQAVSELSHLVTDLRPSQLDHLGLKAALRLLVENYKKRFNLIVDLKFTGTSSRPADDIELSIFRIAQEALTNVVRHAEVNKAQVELIFKPESVQLCICDKGKGFNPLETQYYEEKHWGVLGMMERATQSEGELTIDSTPNQGTRISVQLPLSTSKIIEEVILK